MSKIIESKVAFGAAGGGIGGVLASFLLWVLGVTFWGAPASAGSADLATAAVPAPVAALLLTVLPAGIGLLAGYLAPHTTRPDLTPAAGSLTLPPASMLRVVGESGPTPAADPTPTPVAWPPVGSGTTVPSTVPLVVTNTSTDLGGPPTVTA